MRPTSPPPSHVARAYAYILLHYRTTSGSKAHLITILEKNLPALTSSKLDFSSTEEVACWCSYFNIKVQFNHIVRLGL